ncbi:MAG: hypothetical protein DWQ46_11540 [Planctomycetota bacterium]|nr:MAG: hypothetical protein DWQ46_11540 [Planctomycetota bacterium]
MSGYGIKYTSTSGIEKAYSPIVGERTRFRSILERHASSHASARKQLREVLLDYLRFSPESHDLINELITFCVDLRTPDRLDLAIDLLSSLDQAIYHYAFGFLVRDLSRWSHLYVSGRAYEPNDDYWHILLRSVAQSEIRDELKLKFVTMCQGAASPGVMEGVVEALADIDTEASRDALRRLAEHSDPFIADLAKENLG